jgi:hypothetical protein
MEVRRPFMGDRFDELLKSPPASRFWELHAAKFSL